MAMTFEYIESYGVYKTIKATFETSGAGAASGTTKAISGRIVCVTTIPGAAAPSVGWDVTIADHNGLSIFAQCPTAVITAMGARSNAAADLEYFFLLPTGTVANVEMPRHPTVNGPLTIGVANGGDTKNGTIEIIWHPG